MQIDADIVGDGSMLADIETIFLALQIMKRLSIDSTIRMNNRCILDSLADMCGIPKDMNASLFRIIDKYDKIGINGVMKELENVSFSGEVMALVKRYLSICGTSDEVLETLRELLGNSPSFQAGYDCLLAINDALKDADIPLTSYQIDPTIARGLDYYTGLIFETTFNPDPEYGSVCSGGRYDRLIKGVDGKSLPTIGVSFGLDRLFTAMESISLTSRIKTTTQVFIVNFGNQYLGEYLRLATDLRGNDISVEISPDESKIKKQLRCADAKGIHKVILMGPDELEQGKVVVRNMIDGSQEVIDRKDISRKFKVSC
jgi:histidyl-tRNA synthetase